MCTRSLHPRIRITEKQYVGQEGTEMQNKHNLLLAIIVLAIVGVFGLGIYALGASRYLGKESQFAQTPTPPPDPLAQAYENLKAAADGPLNLTLDGEFPRGVLGRIVIQGETPIEMARNYLAEHTVFYRQDDPNLELHLRRTGAGNVFFYQTYKGLRVYGGELVVYTDGEAVIGTVGSLLTAGLELSTTPSLTPETALEAASLTIDLEDITIVGQPLLVVYVPIIADGPGDEETLAWQINVEGSRSLEMLLNASNGEVLLAYDRHPDNGNNFNIKIQDAAGFNSANTGCFQFPETPTLATTIGFINYGEFDNEAQAAYYKGIDVWSYYHDTYGINSYDNDGERMDIFVHSSTTGTASYSPGCDLFEFTDGSIVDDIYAHEFAHGVIQAYGGLKYKNQSGALNESFADVMGAMYDGNWTVAEGISGNPFRDMSNPSALGDPDHMSEFLQPADCADEDDPSDNDNGCVHTNSGIPNYVAYMLGTGTNTTHPDSQVTVKPIGKARTGLLHFVVMTVGLPSNAQFIDARNAEAGMANALYGMEEACRVKNAWFAVGVGNPDMNCDGVDESPADSDGDMVPDVVDNCDKLYNPNQNDQDGDMLGDPCDYDKDGDGVPDFQDDLLNDPFFLCPTPGKSCNTEDWDGDGIYNVDDNCMFTKNADQADVDSDGEGDACDPDTDGDGISDNDDNCINTPNTDQANADGDLAGDLCDPNPDCDDIFAWSAGSTIAIGGEAVKIPPEPIADPFACPPDVLIDGNNWKDDPPEVNPDNEPHRFELVRGDGPIDVFPLPVCEPDSPEESPTGIHQIVQIHTADPGLNAWVSDGLGNIVSKDRDEGPDGLFQFPPMGGELYHLVFDRSVQQLGDVMSVELMVDCEPKKFAVVEGRVDLQGNPFPEVTLFADLDGNKVLDAGEPSTVSSESDPALTLIGGEYHIEGIPAGTVDIRIVNPDPSVYELVFPQDGFYPVAVSKGDALSGLDFEFDLITQREDQEATVESTKEDGETRTPESSATSRSTDTPFVIPSDTPRPSPTPVPSETPRPVPTSPPTNTPRPSPTSPPPRRQPTDTPGRRG
jgi:Zn-dependent metalloprotease